MTHASSGETKGSPLVLSGRFVGAIMSGLAALTVTTVVVGLIALALAGPGDAIGDDGLDEIVRAGQIGLGVGALVGLCVFAAVAAFTARGRSEP